MKKKELKGKEELRVCYCEEEKNLRPGASFGPVVRDVFIVECCLSGYGTVSVNGTVFPVTPRSVYVLFPGDTVVHTADEKDPRKGVWCSLDGMDLKRHFHAAGINSENPFAPEGLFDELYEQVNNMTKVWRSETAGASLLLSSYAYGLLGTLLSATPRREAEEEWLNRVLGLMRTRYPEDVSVSMLSKEIGMDRAYFSTLFREKTGISPHRYLTELRLHRAAFLLEDLSLSVSQVAQAVGLDPKNFSRLFKKEMGKSPLQYRKT